MLYRLVHPRKVDTRKTQPNGPLIRERWPPRLRPQVRVVEFLQLGGVGFQQLWVIHYEPLEVGLLGQFEVRDFRPLRAADFQPLGGGVTVTPFFLGCGSLIPLCRYLFAVRKYGFIEGTDFFLILEKKSPSTPATCGIFFGASGIFPLGLITGFNSMDSLRIPILPQFCVKMAVAAARQTNTA